MTGWLVVTGTMDFFLIHSVGNVIILTGFHSIIFQRGGSTTNQITTFPPFSPTEKAMSRLGHKNEARPLAGASHRWLRRRGGGDEAGEAGNWHINNIYIYITYILYHILYIYTYTYVYIYLYIYIYYNMHRITNTHTHIYIYNTNII